jgi:type VI secretion system secreted protein Hcp
MAFDAFLKIDGITDTMPNGELRLENYSWGVSNASSAATGSGAGAGKASFQDFSFAALAGKQSPKLFQAAAEGQHILNATLTVTDKTEPITVRFSDVFISNYKLDEGALFTHKDFEGGVPAVQLGAPVESVSFNFLKIEFSVGGTTGSGGTGGGKLF